MIVTASVNQLQGWLCLSNCLLDVLPVHLELLSFLDLLHVKVDNQTTSKQRNVSCDHIGNSVVDLRIVKVFLDKDDSAIFTNLVLLWLLVSIGCSGPLRSSLCISLPISVQLGQFLVTLSSDFTLVVADLQLSRVFAGLGNFLRRDTHLLNLVAVQEVSDGDPTLLVGLNLLAEELVT